MTLIYSVLFCQIVKIQDGSVYPALCDALHYWHAEEKRKQNKKET